METPKTSRKWLNVLVVHWEDSRALSRCLDHLGMSDYPALRVIVVENGSLPHTRHEAEETVGQHRHYFPDIRFLQLTENHGYAGGNNAAALYLDREGFEGDICILNPDVCVQPSTLSVMMGALHGDVGLVMCRALSEQGKVLYDHIRLNGYSQSFRKSSREIEETDCIQGACFLIRRDLARPWLFDESFFLYWEEVDLSLRVKATGLRAVSATAAEIVRSRNSPARLPNAIYYSARNAFFMQHRRPDYFSQAGLLFYLAHLGSLTIKLALKPSLFVAGWKALADGIRDGQHNTGGKRGQLGMAARNDTPMLWSELHSLDQEDSGHGQAHSSGSTGALSA
ncbi:glycosyltransferase family 2 protein [Silvibacterium acidisoli]|uniref:glycosyltransferase family 2 protein n=1 Tax=Acidobacteriaceae bacterium ZG23-2 TaxID=2883246 RepID=UPI00406BFBC2